MEDKNSKNGFQKVDPLFSVVVEERNEDKTFKCDFLVSLEPWTVTNDRTSEVKTGVSLKIQTNKKGKKIAVYLPVANAGIRKAIGDSYKFMDEKNKKDADKKEDPVE